MSAAAGGSGGSPVAGTVPSWQEPAGGSGGSAFGLAPSAFPERLNFICGFLSETCSAFFFLLHVLLLSSLPVPRNKCTN